ncbi:MAG: DUF2029 domain-containing protein [Alphaproteobacteria bacterium]|nr:DUF2029 domain-containing protein [Alphaproteobacteria bacterium]
MNDAELHLVVNHVPVIGALLSVPLLLLTLLSRRQGRGVLRASVLVMVLTGVGAVAAQLTGEPAEEYVEDLPGTYEHAIHEHEENAELATILAVLTALLGLGAVVVAERRELVPPILVGAMLAGSTVTAGAMALTGSVGGEIRHPEAREDAPVVPPHHEDDDEDEDDDD